jgi:Mitochondrial domain of unknown function (DUF1713)
MQCVVAHAKPYVSSEATTQLNLNKTFIWGVVGKPSSVVQAMGSLIKKRRKRMRKKKHKKMLKRTRFQRRAAGK